MLSPSFLAIGSICPLVLFLVAPNFKVVARTSYIDRINCLSNRLASRLSADQQFQCLVDGRTFIVLELSKAFHRLCPIGPCPRQSLNRSARADPRRSALSDLQVAGSAEDGDRGEKRDRIADDA